jgi:hypothetical protein
MITLTREEAQQVLDALEECLGWTHSDLTEAAHETLRSRLAEPEKEQEPVAWLTDREEMFVDNMRAATGLFNHYIPRHRSQAEGEERMKRILIKPYEQAADEKVSIGGIKWLTKWDVCVQCNSLEEAEALKAKLKEPDLTEVLRQENAQLTHQLYDYRAAFIQERDAKDELLKQLKIAQPVACPSCGKVNPAEIHTCSQQKQEPVAWLHTFNGDEQINKLKPEYYGDHWKSEPLYTAPPQQENKFNPDWDAMAVMVEEQQRMAKRIEELEAALREKEPVALEKLYETIIHWDEGGGKRSRRELARRIVALYAAPLITLDSATHSADLAGAFGKREWKRLTKTQCKLFWTLSDKNPPKFYELIDAQLQKQNT